MVETIDSHKNLDVYDKYTHGHVSTAVLLCLICSCYKFSYSLRNLKLNIWDKVDNQIKDKEELSLAM